MPRLVLHRRTGQRVTARLDDGSFTVLQLVNSEQAFVNLIEYPGGRMGESRLLVLRANGCGKCLRAPFRQVVVTFGGINSFGQYQLCFEAPPEIKIDREEVAQSKELNGLRIKSTVPTDGEVRNG